MSPTAYLVLSILFSLGGAGVLIRQLPSCSACASLYAQCDQSGVRGLRREQRNLDGQVIAFFVMVVAAAEVVIGLAIIMTIFRTRRTASVDDANLLKY